MVFNLRDRTREPFSHRVSKMIRLCTNTTLKHYASLRFIDILVYDENRFPRVSNLGPRAPYEDA